MSSNDNGIVRRDKVREFARRRFPYTETHVIQYDRKIEYLAPSQSVPARVARNYYALFSGRTMRYYHIKSRMR